MIRIVSVAQVRRIEAEADSSGLSYSQMMENAGKALADRARALLSEREGVHVLLLIGAGNNGGDGLVAARTLAEGGRMRVNCYLLRGRAGDPLLASARSAGATILLATEDPQRDKLRALCADADLVVDALLGIGLRLPLRDDVALLLETVGKAIAPRRSWQQTSLRIPEMPQPRESHAVPLVLAVDCPSGLDCDSGDIAHQSLPADETLTFIAAKPGLLRPPGALFCGRLSYASAGVAADSIALPDNSRVLADPLLVQSLPPPRPRDSHKGSFGKLLITGGSTNYRGAPGLSALAAQRTGAGLVTVSAPEDVINALAAQQPGVTWLPDSIAALREALPGYTALVLGPGLGLSDRSCDLLESLLALDLPPLLVDADALNLLARRQDWHQLLPPGTIITPHPGELARLANLTLDEVQQNRWQLAPELADRWNVTLVFKGAFTLVASPNEPVTVMPFNSDALARAGSGDVLAGAIGALLAQGCPPQSAAIAGTYLQGLAGLLAAEKAGSSRSPLATEIADGLAAALKRTEPKWSAWPTLGTR
ncbi:MAG: NAD(P)H-hydrate dehydratase [Anaerolineaceae bacterium]|nr:NAD(P)H-hydrate dehydratase [Anaerolineaceae bacterium]